jgi:hypothetical protein
MKQTFTDNEVKFLIVLVILSLLRGGYNMYKLYTVKDEKREKILSSIKSLSDKVNEYSFFSIVQFVISVLYLFSSVYFFVNDKIKTQLFALVCLFMFTRSVAYFTVRFLGGIPFIPDNAEPNIIYNLFVFINVLMLAAGAYFAKVIFFA